MARESRMGGGFPSSAKKDESRRFLLGLLSRGTQHKLSKTPGNLHGHLGVSRNRGPLFGWL